MGAGRLAATLATTAAALACVPVSGAAYSTHAALKGVCVVAAAWVAAWRSARFRGATTFELLLASVLALGLASAFGSHDGYAAALALAPLLAWLLIARGVRHSPEVGLDTVATLLTGSSAIVCGLALAEALGARLPWSVIARPGSTLGGRNYVAEYLVIALPLVVWHVSAKPTVGRVLTAGAMATVVCVARCRGAWLAFALSTLVVLLLGGRGLAHRAVVVAMLCGIIAGASAPWPGLRFTSDVASTAARLLEHKTGSGRVRLEQHRLGVTIVSRAPLLGVGPGGFEDAASEHAHRVGRRPHPVRAAATPNSDWVRIGVEHGLLGLLLFGAALSTLVLGSLRAALQRARADLGPVALVGSWVALGVCSTFDAALFRWETIGLAAVLAGVTPQRTISIARIPGLAALAAGPAVFALVSLAAVSQALTLVGLRKPAERIVWEERAARWFPRGAGVEALALQHARAGACERARAHLVDAQRRGPHHWGAALEVARCYGARDEQDERTVRGLLAQVLAIEPRAGEISVPRRSAP